ncbi:MAG TPA: hypothetical protein VKS82_23770 [Streptosporangiaceae bacterium]|nr:hypothetical protein [Streptosporangiaceae bacterium]
MVNPRKVRVHHGVTTHAAAGEFGWAAAISAARSPEKLVWRMQITAFEEHDSVPWNALPGKMTQIGNGEWRLARQPGRLPHSYTLQAVKRG